MTLLTMTFCMYQNTPKKIIALSFLLQERTRDNKNRDRFQKATEATLTQTDVPLPFLENLENLGQYTIQSTQSHSKRQCQLCDHADLDTGFLM